VWVRKASESEPLMTCRNKSQWRRNRFRVRKVRTRHGDYFFGFNPAVSDVAAKRIRAQIRSWRLHLRSGWTLKDLAREINMTVRVDQLLRAVLPVGVVSQPQPHQRLPGAVDRA